MFVRHWLTILAIVLAALIASAWLTGQAESRTLGFLAIGLLFFAIFAFVISLVLRLWFQRLRFAIASLLAVALVVLGTLYLLPLIDAYRQGYDVSRNLFHPAVFGSLGLAIVLLTQRNHHRS